MKCLLAGDRGYVMERSMDKKTGREERHENFLNMDESKSSTDACVRI